MKLVTILLAALFFTPALRAEAFDTKDTVTINFGNESKIIIYVKDKNDLKALQNYDINQMLRDLQISIDSVDDQAQYLKIQDSTGTRYLKDTAIAIDYDDIRPFELTGYQKEIPVARFNLLDVGNNFELFVKRSPVYKLILAGEKEDVEDVRVMIRNGTLKLGFSNSIPNRRKVRVHLEMPELNDVDISGAARAKIVGFETDEFRADISGAGNADIMVVADASHFNVSGAAKLKLIGKGDRLYADVSGAGRLDAVDFEVDDASVTASGAGKIWVNSETIGSLSTSGAGRIYRKGKYASDNKYYRSNNDFPERVRIKIGKYEFKAEADDWERTGENLEDIDSFNEFKERVEKEEYIQESTPPVRHALNFDFGMNNYLENGSFPDAGGADYSVRPWGSWYVGINSNHRFHIAGPVFLEWGKGVNWYNFKFENDRIRALKQEDGLIFQEDPDHTDAIKSKLTASYISMSLVPVIDFSRGLRRVKSYSLEGFNFTKYDKRGVRIGVGPYIGYRIGSHTKFVYRDAGREKEKDRGNFYLNNWRYGIRGQMGYKALDVFFNYDMSELFVGSGNPSLNAFSFGIIF